MYGISATIVRASTEDENFAQKIVTPTVTRWRHQLSRHGTVNNGAGSNLVNCWPVCCSWL